MQLTPAMRMKLLAAAALLVVAGVVVWKVRGSSSTPSNGAPSEPSARVALPGPAGNGDLGAERIDRGGLSHDDDPIGTQRLEGQVIDEEENPIGGAVVAIDSNPRRQVTSGSDGTFAFEALSARIYRVEARKGDSVAGPVRTRLTEGSDPIVLRLRPASSIAVTVVDVRDQPIAGALVELRAIAMASASSDADGRAVLRGIAADTYALKVAASGYATAYRLIDVPAQAGAVIEQRITLTAGVAVSGVVLDFAGRPVEGARVLAEEGSALLLDTEPRLDSIVTDAKGRWRFSGLPAATVRFRAWHPRFAPGVSPPVVLADGADRDGITITLEQGAVVSGVVVDTEGRPRASASVNLRSANIDSGLVRRTHCDEQGNFTIAGLPRDLLLLVASDERATSSLVEIDVRNRETVARLTVVLDGVATISGIVVTPDGVDVPDARVMAIPELNTALGERTEDQLRGHAASVAGSDGTFVITGLQPGNYQLRAIPPGASTELFWMRKGPLVAAGSADVRLTVDQETSLTGTVAYADGTHPELFSISVGNARGRPFVGKDGRFRIDGVSAGRRYVQVYGPSFERLIVESVDLEANEVNDVGTFVVKRGRQVSGRVLDSSGNGVAGALVYCGTEIESDGRSLGSFGDDAELKRTVSGADGSYLIRGLGRAPLVVAAEHHHMGRSKSAVVPSDSGDQRVDLIVYQPGSLEGRVTSNGQPLQTLVVLRPDQGANTQITVLAAEDGRYRFDRLAPGRYTAATFARSSSGSGGGAGSIEHVVIEPGGVTQQDFDVVVGTVRMTLRFESADPAQVFGYGIMVQTAMFDQPMSLTIDEARSMMGKMEDIGVLKEGFMLEKQTISFDGVPAGRFVACVAPFAGDPRDPEVLKGFQTGEVEQRMYCEPTTVAETPLEQTVVVHIPAQP